MYGAQPMVRAPPPSVREQPHQPRERTRLHERGHDGDEQVLQVVRQERVGHPRHQGQRQEPHHAQGPESRHEVAQRGRRGAGVFHGADPHEEGEAEDAPERHEDRARQVFEGVVGVELVVVRPAPLRQHRVRGHDPRQEEDGGALLSRCHRPGGIPQSGHRVGEHRRRVHRGQPPAPATARQRPPAPHHEQHGRHDAVALRPEMARERVEEIAPVPVLGVRGVVHELRQDGGGVARHRGRRQEEGHVHRPLRADGAHRRGRRREEEERGEDQPGDVEGRHAQFVRAEVPGGPPSVEGGVLVLKLRGVGAVAPGLLQGAVVQGDVPVHRLMPRMMVQVEVRHDVGHPHVLVPFFADVPAPLLVELFPPDPLARAPFFHQAEHHLQRTVGVHHLLAARGRRARVPAPFRVHEEVHPQIAFVHVHAGRHGNPQLHFESSHVFGGDGEFGEEEFGACAREETAPGRHLAADGGEEEEGRHQTTRGEEHHRRDAGAAEDRGGGGPGHCLEPLAMHIAIAEI
mmetsp:Transcript_12457/g.24840  ORF Transcript_12457/g.24840 Transcript_12457/m.24840 type:complete len:516 (-) Transcript_12457:76-1623(-)